MHAGREVVGRLDGCGGGLQLGQVSDHVNDARHSTHIGCTDLALLLEPVFEPLLKLFDTIVDNNFKILLRSSAVGE